MYINIFILNLFRHHKIIKVTFELCKEVSVFIKVLIQVKYLFYVGFSFPELCIYLFSELWFGFMAYQPLLVI